MNTPTQNHKQLQAQAKLQALQKAAHALRAIFPSTTTATVRRPFGLPA